MKIISILILFLLTSSLTAIAEERILDLQQRANYAYEQMMKAKFEAEKAANEAADAEKILHKANQALEQAQQNWNKASDALANEWEKPKRN